MNSSQLDNETLLEICPNHSKFEEQMIKVTGFWLDGIVKTVLAVVGILSNCLAGYVLNRPKMKNSFNKCLIALAVFDSIFLTVSIIESFRRRFGLHTQLHLILVPHFIYPLSNISLTASIYMIVAISLERYCAVHYPVDYRQATQDSTLMIKRMWRYLGPVLLVSVLINITKFFELCVVTTKEGKYNFSVTDLRRNITYSTITNWTRLIFMGALPLVIIVYFNMKVYQDVRERSAKNFKKRNQQASNKSQCSKMTDDDKIYNEENPLRSSDKKSQKCDDNNTNNAANENRRKAEDKLAIIFLVIILGFIFCHFPRVAIDVHEIATLEHFNLCAKHKLTSFPAWTIVTIYISNFCLAINASLNMCIYCFMSTPFREEVFTVLRKLKCQRTSPANPVSNSTEMV